MSEKEYLGDGVYVEPDFARGFITLTTENGIAIQNTIHMEMQVWRAFRKYLAQVDPADEVDRQAFEEFANVLDKPMLHFVPSSVRQAWAKFSMIVRCGRGEWEAYEHKRQVEAELERMGREDVEERIPPEDRI